MLYIFWNFENFEENHRFSVPKLIENRPLGQILASKVAQNRRLSPRSCPKSSLERPKSSLAHPKGALCRPNLVPGGSQPLPGGPWGSPGPSKTSIFLKERLTFPLCAPQRSHTPPDPPPSTIRTVCAPQPPPSILVFSTLETPTLDNQPFEHRVGFCDPHAEAPLPAGSADLGLGLGLGAIL